MTAVEETAPPAGSSLEHLLAYLTGLEQRVGRMVARRRASDPEPDDRFRGLYLSRASVDEILARGDEPVEPPADALRALVEAQSDGWEAAGETLRLRNLARAFGLDPLDLEMLVTALAPDVDRRFEALYGYLQDDVTRRRAGVGLALELVGVSSLGAHGRRRLGPAGPLVHGGLVMVEEPDRPFLTRALRVPDRVTAHLLGDDAPDPDVATAIVDAASLPAIGRLPSLDRAVDGDLGPIYLRETGAGSGPALARGAVARRGGEPLVLDLERLSRAPRPGDVAGAAIREARLRGLTLIGGPIEALVERAPDVVRLLADAACPVILSGKRAWDPRWSTQIVVALEAAAPPSAERLELWSSALNGDGGSHDEAIELLRATSAFRLSPPQIVRAVWAAKVRASVEDRGLEPRDLQAGARAQNAAGLDRLARRVEPLAGWSDLVLPPAVRLQLHELAARARQRERVFEEWELGRRSTRGSGVTGLFAGESGTGKTLAAEVIAAELGLDLYVIDLSTVIDKYIGETEKNLDRIFDEADRINGVLLFDEADAIFGKRSEVRDARDRYANVEVAYLLQRMERFDGLAILTTNLRANLDEAFTRRIDVIVDFPMPQEEGRLALWRSHLPAGVAQEPNLDLEFMARRFRLSGGNIRNVCLTAAFLAADRGSPVSMADLIWGTEREYRKLGRLTVEAEFGPYHALLTAEAPQIAGPSS